MIRASYIVRLVSLLFISEIAAGQMPDFINSTFPKGTVFHQNIPYANDTVKKHLLDIYLPEKASSATPLVIWVHGGAWMMNDKYADMGYMKNTIRAIMEKGYALASIDYRHSTTAIFPAQIQDCHQAIEFLYNNASKYKLDKNRFALMGFSAGGHLASLLALSLNNDVKSFYPSGKKPSYSIKTVLDFYGPSDFLMFYGSATTTENNHEPISTLLGASALKRPDIAKLASPDSYVDKNDPPFFIVHGEKDESVPVSQSLLLKSYFDAVGVVSELTIVKDAPHFGEMFDTEDVRAKLLSFLDQHLKK
jgi:acetyl esterase/lipase